MKVKIQRLSSRLLGETALLLGEGMHAMFRKSVDHRAAMAAHRAIGSMTPAEWSEMTLACAQTALTWVLKHESLTNSVAEREKLSHNLARRFVKEARRLKNQGDSSWSQPAILYVALDDIGFQKYREGLLGVADTVITVMTRPHDKCGDCRCSRQCPTCKQKRCAVHCRCTKETNG